MRATAKRAGMRELALEATRSRRWWMSSRAGSPTGSMGSRPLPSRRGGRASRTSASPHFATRPRSPSGPWTTREPPASHRRRAALCRRDRAVALSPRDGVRRPRSSPGPARTGTRRPRRPARRSPTTGAGGQWHGSLDRRLRRPRPGATSQSAEAELRPRSRSGRRAARSTSSSAALGAGRGRAARRPSGRGRERSATTRSSRPARSASERSSCRSSSPACARAGGRAARGRRGMGRRMRRAPLGMPAVAQPALDHGRGLVALAAGATGVARRALESAIDGWDERGRVWEATWARLDLASCLTRQNRFADAMVLAVEARSVASRLDSRVARGSGRYPAAHGPRSRVGGRTVAPVDGPRVRRRDSSPGG